MTWRSVLRSHIFGLLFATLLVIPMGYAAAADGGNLGVHLQDPILIDSGYISGTMIDALSLSGANKLVGEVGDPVRIYRAIPYAAPPV